MNKPRLRRFAVAALSLAALLLFAACGSSTTPNEMMSTAAAAPGYAPQAAAEMPETEFFRYEGGANGDVAYDDATAATGGGNAGGPTLTLPQDGRKIILTAHLTIEALDYDDTCTKLQQAALDSGGYISSTSVSGGAAGSGRSASFTMRIPADRYGAFLEAADKAGNMVSRTENSDDVTSQYVDIEARLKALRTQEARLLELMETSARLTDLLEVQSQLTEVQYQIESYVAQKRSLDDLTAYSTAYVSVQEVRQITEPVQDTYLSRLGQTFRSSWRAAGVFFQEVGLFLVRILPLLLFIGIALAVAIPLARRAAKKRAARPKPPKPVNMAAGPQAAWPPYPPAAGPAEESPAKPEKDSGNGTKHEAPAEDDHKD